MGVMASVLGVIQTHVVTEQSGPLVELLGPLMGLITTHYLDTRGVEREVERGVHLARAIQTGEAGVPGWALARSAAQDLWQGAVLPAMFGSPGARRARECLLFLAEQGGRGLSPSNREIATGIGVVHQSQISRLLAHLAGEGLVVKGSRVARTAPMLSLHHATKHSSV
jgi:hypothetical protein